MNSGLRYCLALGALVGCHPPQMHEGKNRIAHTESDRPILFEVVHSSTGDPPAVRFAFAPPEDAYAGSVPTIRGELQLGPDLTLRTAGGTFIADVLEVTLGDPDLDKNVRNNVEFLEGSQFPTARFIMHAIESDHPRLEIGRESPVTLVGEFELKGRSVPLRVPGSIQARRDDADSLSLLLLGEFELTGLRERFSIAGPGGQHSDAGNRLRFHVRLALCPRGSK